MLLRRTYFSLNEIYTQIKTSVSPVDTTPVGYLNAFCSLFSYSIEETGFYFKLGTNAFADAFNEVLYILFNDHASDFFYFVDTKAYFNSEAPELTNEICIEAVKRLLATYQATQDRYNLLIGLYASNKANLLNKIESIQQNYFNDTPQNYGDYTNESHLTNYSKQVNENDLTSLMNRLDDIQNKFRNLIGDWANEFRGLFYFGD